MSTHEYESSRSSRMKGPTPAELDQEIKDIGEEALERYGTPGKAIEDFVQQILDAPHLVIRIVQAAERVRHPFRGYLWSLLQELRAAAAVAATGGATATASASAGPKPRTERGRHRASAEAVKKLDSVINVDIPTWQEIQTWTYRQTRTWLDDYGPKVERLIPAYQLMRSVVESVGEPDDWDRKIEDLVSPRKFAALRKRAGYK